MADTYTSGGDRRSVTEHRVHTSRGPASSRRQRLRPRAPDQSRATRCRRIGTRSSYGRTTNRASRATRHALLGTESEWTTWFTAQLLRFDRAAMLWPVSVGFRSIECAHLVLMRSNTRSRTIHRRHSWDRDRWSDWSRQPAPGPSERRCIHCWRSACAERRADNRMHPRQPRSGGALRQRRREPKREDTGLTRRPRHRP